MLNKRRIVSFAVITLYPIYVKNASVFSQFFMRSHKFVNSIAFCYQLFVQYTMIFHENVYEILHRLNICGNFAAGLYLR